MGVLILELAGVIPNWTEPYDAFPVDLELHRLHLSDQHINSEVPLCTSNKKWLDLLLNNTLLLVLQVINPVDDGDAASSTDIYWLANPDAFFFAWLFTFLKVLQKLLIGKFTSWFLGMTKYFIL